MPRITHHIASTVLFAALACSVSAQDDWAWTGGGGDGLWNTGANWDRGTPPPATAGHTALGSGTTITIPAGETQTPGLNTEFANIYGPEWGGTLNIHGTLNYNWYIAPVGASGTPSTINMFGTSSLSGEGIGLGHNWWFHDAPYATLNLYGDSTAQINWLFWGGRVNLAGGTLTIAVGITDNNEGLISDSTRFMDITGGRLVLGFGDQTALVNDWIARGILQAYGGSGEIVIDTVSTPGQTVVTAVPEPASLALLAGGALGACLLRRRRNA